MRKDPILTLWYWYIDLIIDFIFSVLISLKLNFGVFQNEKIITKLNLILIIITSPTYNKKRKFFFVTRILNDWNQTKDRKPITVVI